MDVEANFSFLAFSLPRCHGCKPKEGINNRCWRPLPSKLRQLPCDHVVTTFQVESRSPDRNESSKEEAASNKCTTINGDCQLSFDGLPFVTTHGLLTVAGRVAQILESSTQRSQLTEFGFNSTEMRHQEGSTDWDWD